MTNTTFRKAIDLANSGSRLPVMSLVREDPGLAAVISKMIPATETPAYGHDGNRQPTAPNISGFKNIAEQTAQNATDAETVMQILPEMELASQILISSVLAPKDMMTTELTYGVPEGLMAPDIVNALITRTKEHFEQVYKIKPQLPGMLRDILFETGSYAAAVIPENSIDEVINSRSRMSMESFRDSINADGSIKPKGLLGPAIKKAPTAETRKPGMSMEAFNDFRPDLNQIDGSITFEGILDTPVRDSFVTVTDNYDLLKIPRINQKIREQRISSMVGSKALESITSKLNDREMTQLVFKNRPFAYKPISSLKTQEELSRRTVGNPLIMHLPSESVIPVYVPGAVDQQVGFFVLIDADGNPIQRQAGKDFYGEMGNRLNNNGSFPSAMLNKTKSMMSGSAFDINNRGHLDYSAKAYGQMVEQDLLARLRNGVYGNGVALARNEEVYRIMLARALSKQHTQLLFVPVEIMTYFALRHNEHGVGKSLLEDMKILNSLRSMLLFANVMASLKNSIGRTEVKFKLDEADPDPKKTIEVGMHEIIRSRQQAFPLGTNSPTDLTDWLMRSGYEFTFEGHPGIPDLSIDFGEKNTNYTKPDTELEDSLRKRSIMSLGLPPETVDAGFNAEFATSIVTQNILLSKRVTQIQEQFTPQLSDHMRKVIMNSENLVNDLRDILLSNIEKLRMSTSEKKEVKQDVQAGIKAPDAKSPVEAMDPADRAIKKIDATVAEKRATDLIVNQFLMDFIMNFEVTLPRPNSVTLENQMLAMETYAKALDVSLDAWISQSFYTTETGGDVANQVETIKAVVKGHFLRQWMAENGVMTELGALTTSDDDGKPTLNVFDITTDHIESLTKSLAGFMKKIDASKQAGNKVMAGLNVDTTTTSSGSDDMGMGGGSPSGGGFGGGGGGDDIDLTGLGGMDDALGGLGELEPGGDDKAPDQPTEESSETSETSESSTTDETGKVTTKKTLSSSSNVQG